MCLPRRRIHRRRFHWRVQELENGGLKNSRREIRGAVLQVRDYTATELLRDGRTVEIRALRPEDRVGMLAAVSRTSQLSLYRRFFTFKRGFTAREVDFYVNVNFVDHVALVAVLEEDGQPVIVAGGRYIVVGAGEAEVAFVVDDAHQGRGLGASLMRHLAALARQAGLKALSADVLPENAAMLKVFETSGLGIKIQREPDSIHVMLQL
jgi:GNAT superfamily N-acetyltransferase